MRELRVHGQEKRYYHTRIGINGRMDTLQAAILLSKLEIFPEEVQLRLKWGKVYKDLLGNNFKTQLTPMDQTSVYAQFTIEVENRDQFIKRMSELGIPTAVHYPIPLHLQPVYHFLGFKKGDFPHAESAAERVVSLPMHPYLNEEIIETVVKAVKRCHVDLH
jgi:UDP-2-acetamido-2-deoxy-ribo-hexuluronate aminotransferase